MIRPALAAGRWWWPEGFRWARALALPAGWAWSEHTCGTARLANAALFQQPGLGCSGSMAAWFMTSA